MKYHELQLKSHKSNRRVGRGISAGQGKTAGRGTKGQNSRAGSGRKPGFEGGQNSLIQRLPKLRGFKSHRQTFANVYTSQINNLNGIVDNAKLAEAGLVASPFVKVKLLFNEDVSKKLSVKLQAASKAAVVSLQKKGGIFEMSSQVGRPATKPSKVDKNSR